MRLTKADPLSSTPTLTNPISHPAPPALSPLIPPPPSLGAADPDPDSSAMPPPPNPGSRAELSSSTTTPADPVPPSPQSGISHCSSFVAESDVSVMEEPFPALQLPHHLTVNTCVVVKYPDRHYPGVVISTRPLRVRFLKPHKTKKNVFVHPEVKDIKIVDFEMISTYNIDLVPLTNSAREWKVLNFDFQGLPSCSGKCI